MPLFLFVGCWPERCATARAAACDRTNPVTALRLPAAAFFGIVLGAGCLAHPADCPLDAITLKKKCSGADDSASLLALLFWALQTVRGPQFAYVTSTGLGGNDILSAYRVNEATGNLEHIGNTTVESDPFDLTVDQTGRYLYVMNSASNTISQFRINRSTGALTTAAAPLACVTTPFAGPTLLGGSQLYVPSGSAANQLGRYAIDGGGALTFVETVSGPAAGNQVWFMRGTPDSRFLYASIYNAANVAQYSVNATTGALAQLAPFTVATQTNPWSVEVEPTGRFAYVANYGSASVSQFAINSTTGQLTPVVPATVAAGTQPVGIAIHPNSTNVYVANSGDGTLSQYRIDGSTGALSPLNPATVVAAGAYGLAIDRTGRFLYACNSTASAAHQFAIGSEGTLIPQTPATVTTGSLCRFIAIAGG